jgi:hypothetical protein
MKTKEKMIVLLSGLLIVLFCFSAMQLIAVVSNDYQKYQSESDCVRPLIAQGIERKDIATGNGTCWIKE